MRGNKIGMLVLIGVLSAGIATLQAGVRQIRTTNTTNIGTNAYADMQDSYDNSYATVNPNYSDRGTVYHGENGVVAVNPGNAVVYTNDYGTAIYNGNDAVVTGGYYYDYNSWAGSAAQGNMIPMGTIIENLPSTAVPITVSGARYYYDSNIYLAEVFDGSMIVYQVVPAPMGAVVTMLPAGCTVQYLNGKSFSICGGTYYQQVAGGYQVVAGLN